MTETIQLSELQHAVIRVLWDRREATVSEVHTELRAARNLAPTTVATLLTRMEKKGWVAHRSEGRQFVYSAVISEQEVRRSVVSDLAERVFEGDVAAVVNQLLDARDVSPDELARVRRLIEAKERELEAKNDD